MKRILQPVIENIPLFLISILLMGGFDVGYQNYLFHEVEPFGVMSAYQEIIITSYFVCLISFICKRIHLKVFFYFILFILYAFSCYMRYAYSTDITPSTLLLLLETNTKEATGYLKTYLSTMPMIKTIMVITILLTLTLIGEHFRKQLIQISLRPICKCFLTIILLFGAVGCFSMIKRYWELSLCQTAYEAEGWKSGCTLYKSMPIPNLYFSITANNLASDDLFSMIDATKKSITNVTLIDNDSLNIILVIGESFNKYHASLYGYPLNTTPTQCKEQNRGNLYAFTHVKAPHNMTSVVLKNLLCCNNVHEGERWQNYAYFPAIFKKAGYDVWFWDNQYQSNPVMAFSLTLNSILFNKEIEQLSYTAYNEVCTTYDDGLIADFKQKKGSKLGSHNLIIFHLNGQHRPANTQYPQEKEYQVFSAKDIKDPAPYLNEDSRQRIAEYDNATLFNDQVMKQIMDLVRDTKAVLIYFSDHGEEVYDYRDFLGRSLLEEAKITPELVKYQIEIPFIVWVSDKWKQQNEAEWQRMGEAIDREFSIDNVCHLLFRLGGVKTKDYKPSRDLFSPEFIPQTKEYDIWNVL